MAWVETYFQCEGPFCTAMQQAEKDCLKKIRCSPTTAILTLNVKEECYKKNCISPIIMYCVYRAMLHQNPTYIYIIYCTFMLCNV